MLTLSFETASLAHKYSLLPNTCLPSIYTETTSYAGSTKILLATLTIKAGTATSGSKTSYKCQLDGIADYAASSTLDVATISYEPSTINLVLGTSYLFTVTLTGYSANYTENIAWTLNDKALTAKSVSKLILYTNPYTNKTELCY